MSAERDDAPGPCSSPTFPSTSQRAFGVADAPARSRHPFVSSWLTSAVDASASSYWYRSARPFTDSQGVARACAETLIALYGTGLNAPQSVQRLKYGRYRRTVAETVPRGCRYVSVASASP